MSYHVFFGYSVLFLVLFLILYGFVGSKYARFSDFLCPPAQIADYLKGLLIRKPKHFVGHNPAGGLMIVILLLSLLALTLTGLEAYGIKGHGPLAKHEISFMTNAFADDDRYRKRHRYRGGSEKNDDDNDDNDRNDYLKPVTNQKYKETCGECHFAYQPELLPSASWLKILNQLDDHFGEEIEADPDTIKTISDYLRTNGAENSSAKRSKKIMRSLGNQVPMRISDIPYIREKHHELEPAIFKRESVGSLANCTACHITAEKGIYDDDDVKIPK